MDEPTDHPTDKEEVAVEGEAVDPRSLLAQGEEDIGEEQEDQVGFEARDTNTPPIDYEALQDGEAPPPQEEEEEELAAISASEAMWNPSQGVQAEAPEEQESAPADGETRGTENVRRLSVERSDVLVVAPPSETRAEPSLDNDTYAPSREELTVGKKEGRCPIILIVEPMRFRVRLTVPVYAKEQDGNTSGAWSLIAKDLFETVATFLKVHPESFHLYKNSTERIRFMSILFIDRDVSTESAEAVTSEPLWVTLVFPPPTVSGKTEFAFDRRPEEEEDALPPQDLEEVDSLTMEEMLSRVPAHLAQVGPDEQLVKCIRVRTEKPYIHPNTLVEARLKHGLTYDQVIQSINHAAADDAESAIVAIIRSIAPGGKAFLGGYRDKNDHSRQFLHASTQLFMKNLNYSPFGDRRNAPQDICSRQTQTYGTSRSCQTLREYSSQTPRTDLLLDDTESVTVRARPYFTAEMLRELRTAKAIILQKMYRQWKARGIRRSLEEAEMEKQRRAAARQRAEEAGKMDAAQREQLRLSEPRTVKDFEALKEQIIKWREEESAAIRGNSSLSEEEKRLAQLALTKQELKLLQEVESRRRLTLLDRNDRKFDRTMDAMSSARNWGTVKVETQETQRAGELRDLYRALSDRTLVQNARLDVLLHVKWTVKEFENSLTQELTQLIDREADLLQRGRREASLDGLRTRIQNLFKQFIEDPEYNPMMAQYTKTATGRAKVRQMWEKSEGGGMTSSTRGGSTYLKSGNSTKRN